MSNPLGVTAKPPCVYCGRRCNGLTCFTCADLPALDPDWRHFTRERAARVLAVTPARAPALDPNHPRCTTP